MRIRKPGGIRKLTSVRSRLTFWNVLALTVALTAVSIQIRYSVGANILASIDRELGSMARFASRMSVRRPRGRGQVPGQFIGASQNQPRGSAPTTLSGELRQMDQAVGVSTPAGISPSSVFGGTERQNQISDAPPDLNAPTAPVAQPLAQPPPSALPPARPGGLPSIPVTRVFVNGPRTFMNEAPWDLGAYRRSLSDSNDIYTTVRSGDRSHRLLTRSIHGMTGNNTVIQCAFPLSEMDRAVHSLDVTLLTTIPLVLLIAGLGGAFLTDRAMRPVRQITRTAEQIGAEDLSRRLPIDTDDEFAQLAGTFNAMLGRLETSFVQQRRFTADASHELKSPLTVIKANTSLALRSPRSADEYLRRIEAIDRASNHMKVLVDDLLLLARADEGRLAANGEPISIHELLQDAAESTCRPDAAPLNLKLPGTDLVLEANRHELMRVFCNLFDNALRYTPATGSVTVTAIDEGVAVCITVEDTGSGIPAEHIAHLGERFYRVDPSRTRAHGGSGLGLAICRSIVEAHHGDIVFRSRENQGTTVTVTLPTTHSDMV